MVCEFPVQLDIPSCVTIGLKQFGISVIKQVVLLHDNHSSKLEDGMRSAYRAIVKVS